MEPVSSNLLFDVSHSHLKFSLQSLWVTTRGGGFPVRSDLPCYLSFYPSVVVFSGLRPSRKLRWVPLLPHRPLRLLLSRQGPRSRRRRSWALTMRSRRTLQITAKVRTTLTHSRTHTLEPAPVCDSLPFLPPDGICSSIVKTIMAVVTPAFQGCLDTARKERRSTSPAVALHAKDSAVCWDVHVHNSCKHCRKLQALFIQCL